MQRTQVIEIRLELADGQPPYSNSVESGSRVQPPYDHLVQFFEQLSPSYKVKQIASRVQDL